MLYGENKLIGEEAFVGGTLGASVAAIISSLFVTTDTLNAFVADKFPRLAGAVSPTAWASYVDNYFTSVLSVSAAVALLTIGFVGGFVLFGWQRSRWHFQGMSLETDTKKSVKLLQSCETLLMSSAQKSKQTTGVIVGGVELSRTRETAHIALAGLPGSGKTVLLNNLLLQVIARGDRVIAHDPKGDLTAWMYNDSVVLLGPWDERASCWDIASDIDNAELVTSFAHALVVGSKKDDNGKGNAFFDNAAEAVIAGLLKHYLITYKKDWSWDTFAADVAAGPVNIISKAIKGDPVVASLCSDVAEGKQTNDTTRDISATVGTAVSWLLAYAGTFDIVRNDGKIDRAQSKMFSIKKWLGRTDHTAVQAVVLNNNANYSKRVEQIFGAVLASASSYINSPEMPEVSADATGFWLVLDEYPQLGAGCAEYIQKMEEVGRSRGIRVVKALQDESQLFAAVGREKGEAQRSVQQTRIYAKLATGLSISVQ